MDGNAEPRAVGTPRMPRARPVAVDDIAAAVRAGLSDFVHAPLFGLFFGAIYAVGGLIILASLMLFEMPWMIIPIAVGFPLIGPFVAAGLYEVSRVRAAGGQPEWRDVLLVVVSQRQRQLGWMAFVVLFVFWIWIYQVRLLLAVFLGFRAFSSIGDFIAVVTTTGDGLAFLALGTVVGAFLAFVLFCTTVIAMPLLLDRDLDFVSAMITSFQVVFASPVVMIGWGIIIAASAIAAMIPAFLGLLVVLPVLGHATWHLYKRAVEWPA